MGTTVPTRTRAPLDYSRLNLGVSAQNHDNTTAPQQESVSVGASDCRRADRPALDGVAKVIPPGHVDDGVAGHVSIMILV